MEDNEYNPELYKLQKKDLIPLFGLVNYILREQNISKKEDIERSTTRVFLSIAHKCSLSFFDSFSIKRIRDFVRLTFSFLKKHISRKLQPI